MNTFDQNATHYVAVTARTDDSTFPKQSRRECSHRHKSPYTAMRCGRRLEAEAYSRTERPEVLRAWAEPVPNPIGRTYGRAYAN